MQVFEGSANKKIMSEAEEDKANLIELLLEKASEYGKSTYELLKLKTIDKTSDVVSSFIPHSLFFIIVGIFLLFLNLGLALWLGDILGKAFYGFLVVAGFYFVTGIVIHFFMHKWLKKVICNYIIKLLLK